MGTRSYIVRGLGNPASYTRARTAPGGGMSRDAGAQDADRRRRSTAAMAGPDVERATGPTRWSTSTRQAYKDIDQVMADQADLVEVQHTLRQVFNYKG